MKVNIWVHKNDVVSNKILTYHLTRPIIDRHDEYVQITISQDEFVQLEDKQEWGELPDEENLFVDEEAMIHERNPDTGEIRSRKSKIYRTDNESWLINQYNRNRDIKDHVDNVNDIPKDYSDEFEKKIKKAREVVNELQGFMKVTGGEFRQWFDNLSERAKDMYKNEYKEKK